MTPSPIPIAAFRSIRGLVYGMRGSASLRVGKGLGQPGPGRSELADRRSCRLRYAAGGARRTRQLTAGLLTAETSSFHRSSMQRAADERRQAEEQERAAAGHARDVDPQDAV